MRMVLSRSGSSRSSSHCLTDSLGSSVYVLHRQTRQSLSPTYNTYCMPEAGIGTCPAGAAEAMANGICVCVKVTSMNYVNSLICSFVNPITNIHPSSPSVLGPVL